HLPGTRERPTLASSAIRTGLTGMFPSPYVVTDEDTVFNIISGIRYAAASERGRLLRELGAGRSGNQYLPALPAQDMQWLVDERWAFADEPDVWRASRLRYASIETISACNQTCHFCPVAHSPRPVTRMETGLFERIVT